MQREQQISQPRLAELQLAKALVPQTTAADLERARVEALGEEFSESESHCDESPCAEIERILQESLDLRQPPKLTGSPAQHLQDCPLCQRTVQDFAALRTQFSVPRKPRKPSASTRRSAAWERYSLLAAAALLVFSLDWRIEFLPGARPKKVSELAFLNLPGNAHAAWPAVNGEHAEPLSEQHADWETSATQGLSGPLAGPRSIGWSFSQSLPNWPHLGDDVLSDWSSSPFFPSSTQLMAIPKARLEGPIMALAARPQVFVKPVRLGLMPVRLGIKPMTETLSSALDLWHVSQTGLGAENEAYDRERSLDGASSGPDTRGRISAASAFLT